MSNTRYAHVFKDGVLLKSQRLDSKANDTTPRGLHWLRILHNEVKHLAKKHNDSVYYIEVRSEEM